MVTKNFHGCTVEVAMLILDNIAFYLYENKGEVAKLITGNGKIKDAIFKYAPELGCDIKEEVGNPGVLLMERDDG